MIAPPLLALLLGCVINGDKYPRPRDLTPDWMVDRTRILGVRADPPEAVPGQVVTFQSLIGMPVGGEVELGVVWLACLVDPDAAWAFGCDLGAVDLTAPTPPGTTTTGAFATGVIGFEPGIPPVYPVPDDALDDLTDDEALEGRYALIQVLALPQDVLAELSSGALAFEDVDFAVVESAYKRLIVSAAETPNHNPEIGAFTVEGAPIAAGAAVHVDPGQPYELGLVLPDGTREVYAYQNSDGTEEERVEEPYASWFSTGGELAETVTLWPYLQATWTAPEGVETGRWYAVLRDRRGGMSWFVQDWTTANPGSR
ncbi:MAG: hypothetical protein ABMB14_26415 [Myxococcota bacterium]